MRLENCFFFRLFVEFVNHVLYFQAAKQWRMNAIEENRHNIQANLAAIDAATAAVISKTSGC